MPRKRRALRPRRLAERGARWTWTRSALGAGLHRHAGAQGPARPAGHGASHLLRRGKAAHGGRHGLGEPKPAHARVSARPAGGRHAQYAGHRGAAGGHGVRQAPRPSGDSEARARPDARPGRAAFGPAGAGGVPVREAGGPGGRPLRPERRDGLRGIAEALARRGVCTRAGLHCAPLAHESAGTLESGTVRFSVSPFNTPQELKTAAGILARCLRAG